MINIFDLIQVSTGQRNLSDPNTTTHIDTKTR